MLILDRNEHGDLPVLPVPTDPRRMHQHPAIVVGKAHGLHVIFVITSQKTSDEKSLVVKVGDVVGVVVPIPVLTRDIKGLPCRTLTDKGLEMRLQSYALRSRNAVFFDRERMLAAESVNPLYMH